MKPIIRISNSIGSSLRAIFDPESGPKLLNSEPYSTEEVFASLGMAWIIIFVFVTFLQFGVVDGDSMYSTLKNGDFIVASKLSKIERGDIVIAPIDNRVVVKRVVGVEGDEINGVIVPKGHYYLMGDNRNHSRDSREFGTVNKVIGRVELRIAPKPTRFTNYFTTISRITKEVSNGNPNQIF